MKINRILIILLATLLFFGCDDSKGEKTVTSNERGTFDGYDYEFWKDGSASGKMVLGEAGTFKCEWSNGGGYSNILFRSGRRLGSTKTHTSHGQITVSYNVNPYSPNGNSYLCIYGWTQSPLMEYYIVESWGSWRPPGSGYKTTVNIDGANYDIYETTRTNQPSIEGTRTFQQYWSVRQTKRTSGTINVTAHFNAWGARGMNAINTGRLYEVMTTIEGYGSSGKAEVIQNTISIGK
ncbi:MAG: glycoside hydrolase family 11 protein [Treponema sp.]|nr:glycoside hydrolase family 11 protein [Treponema sp.]